jgi:hypothetical protein
MLEEENNNELLGDDSFTDLQRVYKSEHAKHNPRFHGVEAGYEPVTWGDTVLIVMCTLFLWAICSVMIVVGLYIAMEWKAHNLIFIDFCVVMAFVFLIVIGMFCA